MLWQKEPRNRSIQNLANIAFDTEYPCRRVTDTTGIFKKTFVDFYYFCFLLNPSKHRSYDFFLIHPPSLGTAIMGHHHCLRTRKSMPEVSNMWTNHSHWFSRMSFKGENKKNYKKWFQIEHQISDTESKRSTNFATAKTMVHTWWWSSSKDNGYSAPVVNVIKLFWRKSRIPLSWNCKNRPF